MERLPERLKRWVVNPHSLTIQWDEVSIYGSNQIVAATYHGHHVIVKVFTRSLSTIMNEYDHNDDPTEIFELETQHDFPFPSICRILGIVGVQKSTSAPVQLAVIFQRYDTDSNSWIRHHSERPDLYYIWKILLDSARALAFLHSNGIVHGDVKPSNILLDVSPFEVYLSDLGSACRVEAPQVRPMTPGFVSPQRLATKLPSPSDDAYGLGCTAMFLLDGEVTVSPRTWDHVPLGNGKSESFLTKLARSLTNQDETLRATVSDAIEILETNTMGPVDHGSAPTIPLNSLPYMIPNLPLDGWETSRTDGVRHRDVDISATTGWMGEVMRRVRLHSHAELPGHRLVGMTMFDSITRDVSFLNAIRSLDMQVSEAPHIFHESWRDLGDAADRAPVYELYEKNRGVTIPGYDHTHLTLMFHGFPSRQAAMTAATTGFSSLARMDSGYYGRGTYQAGELGYALRYARLDDGFKYVAVSTVATALVYPVIEHSELAGQPIIVPYDTHYVAVSPVSDSPDCIDFIPTQPDLVRRRVALGRVDPPVFTEIVVGQTSRVLVRYIMKYMPTSPVLEKPPAAGMWLWRLIPVTNTPAPTVFIGTETADPASIAGLSQAVSALSLLTVDSPKLPHGLTVAYAPDHGASRKLVRRLGPLVLAPLSPTFPQRGEGEGLLDIHADVKLGLAENLPDPDRVRLVYIKSGLLHTHGVKKMGPALTRNEIETIAFYVCQWTAAGLKTFGHLISGVASLCTVAFVRCGLTDFLVAGLLEAIKRRRSRIKALVLDNNGLTDMTALNLFTAFRQSQSLEYLSLSHNPITGDGARYLAALKTHNPRLRIGLIGTIIHPDVLEALG
ncbi:Protein kinase domain [Carpediemonas membranifera]|uniref:non-specific serine/threonine protein kinase n=1 Tax=Carpediemonas membranifera TaxID=201153 RepID=A0A8J6BVQ6_9EUKA|nr:Protein kinase domain [Carpediemonas membranifera]|eukprot:KAG9391656.1 Protein kinase domain [Carpediemonas membranifera]